MTTQPPTDGSIDFAILTAIEVEREAVCAAFGLTDEDRIKKDDRWYWRGRLALKTGGSYEIVVAQPVDMGQVEAAILASDVIRHWKPGAALLVGIAATTDPEKIKLGDVVVGKSVWYYEHGKVTPQGTKPQPEMILADAGLLKHLTGMVKWDGNVPTTRPEREQSGSKAHLGVIASGEKLIADAAARDEIASGHRKILAIEMEGYGFSRAVWQSFERVRHLDIRGICDDGSPAKNDDWHNYAAAAAAGFAKHFLLDRPTEPRNSGHHQLPTAANTAAQLHVEQDLVRSLVEKYSLTQDARRILGEKPFAWEGLFFSRVLMDELERISDLRRDLKYGVSRGPVLRLDDSEVLGWISGQIAEIRHIAGAIEAVTNSGLKEAMGAPGAPGDPENMVYVARRIVDGCREAIDWTFRLRRLSVDEEFNKLVSIVQRWGVKLVQDVETWSITLDSELKKFVANPPAPGEPVAFALEGALNAPDREGFDDELTRLAEVMIRRGRNM